MRIAQAGFKQGLGQLSAGDLLAEVGPTMRVDVGLKSRSPAGAAPDLPRKGLHALIDTGAGMNGIDEQLAAELGLPQSDVVEMSGFHGRGVAPVYIARVYVPELDRLLFERFAAAKLAEGGQTHRIILGRQFLRPYRMTYDAVSGQVTLKEP